MPICSRATILTVFILLGGNILLFTTDIPDLHGSLKSRDGAPSLTPASRKYLGVSTERQNLSTNFISSGESTRSSGSAVQPGSSRCADKDARCASWGTDGQCLSNPGFMWQRCWKTCGGCKWSVLQDVPKVATLMNSVTMPRIGFGTAGLGEQTKQATLWALEAGYKMLDSAQAREWYREDLVGAALQESGVNRHSIFITSKLHPRHHGYETALAQFEQSLTDLKTDFLDLFLLHYPRCWAGLCDPPKGTWQDSWRALETLVDAGKIRAIGVSNFDLADLTELLKIARIKPAVVQRNSDPLRPDKEVQAFCFMAGIQYEGYSTLGSQWMIHGGTKNPVLTHPTVQGIAKEVGRGAAQVVLRWAQQHGQVVIPRSAQKSHIAGNLDLDFVLSAKQLAAIDSMDERNFGGR